MKHSDLDLAVAIALARQKQAAHPAPDNRARTGAQRALDTGVDVAKSVGSGLATGAVDIISFLGAAGAGANVPVGEAQGLSRGLLSKVTGGASEFQPQTTPGEFGQTVGQFIPGMALGGTLPQMVLGGLASEAGGQLAEGTKLETPARIAGGFLGGGLPRVARRAATPFPADPERLKLGGILDDADVSVTAGQRTGSRTLRTLEGTQQPTLEQLDELTAAVMKSTGSNARRATGTDLKNAGAAIFEQMDSSVRGVQVRVSVSAAQKAEDVLQTYIIDSPNELLTPRIRNIVDQLVELSTNPNGGAVPASLLKKWRSRLGKKLISPDADTRTAARNLQGVIDELTDASLRAAGRNSDIAKLAIARDRYRNLLVAESATAGAGSLKQVGVISPDPLRTAAQLISGKKQFVTGGGPSLTPLARAAAGVLDTAPTVNPGGARSIQNALPFLLGGAGGAAGVATGNTGLAAAGVMAGVMAPTVGRGLLGTKPIQAYLANQALARGRPGGGLLGGALGAR